MERLLTVQEDLGLNPATSKFISPFGLKSIYFRKRALSIIFMQNQKCNLWANIVEVQIVEQNGLLSLLNTHNFFNSPKGQKCEKISAIISALLPATGIAKLMTDTSWIVKPRDLQKTEKLSYSGRAVHQTVARPRFPGFDCFCHQAFLMKKYPIIALFLKFVNNCWRSLNKIDEI